MAKTTVEIRQLAENNGGTTIAPITTPNAVIFEDGSTLNDKINNFSYSLNETNLGIKWIDGKDIYRKVICLTNTTTSYSTNTTYSCNIGTNIGKIIRFDVLTTGNNGNNQEVNKYIERVRYTKSSGIFQIICTSGYTVNSVYCIAEYTKE